MPLAVAASLVGAASGIGVGVGAADVVALAGWIMVGTAGVETGVPVRAAVPLEVDALRPGVSSADVDLEAVVAGPVVAMVGAAIAGPVVVVVAGAVAAGPDDVAGADIAGADIAGADEVVAGAVVVFGTGPDVEAEGRQPSALTAGRESEPVGVGDGPDLADVGAAIAVAGAVVLGIGSGLGGAEVSMATSGRGTSALGSVLVPLPPSTTSVRSSTSSGLVSTLPDPLSG